MQLQFPPEGTPDYTWFEFQLEKETGTYPGCEGSFCRTFMEAVDREIKKRLGSKTLHLDTSLKGTFRNLVEAKDLITGHERGDSKVQYGHMIDVCNRINLSFDQCRTHINEVMVDFLMNNNGVIDRWPVTNDACGISAKHDPLGPDAAPLEFPFAYFGSKYVPAGYKVHREFGDKPHWINRFYCGHTEELNELHDQYKALNSEYCIQKGTRDIIGILKSACILLVPVLTAAFLIFSLIWYFMGVNPTSQTLEWFLSAEQVIPRLFLYIPKWLLSAVAMISSLLRPNPVVFWISTPLLTLLGGCASASILKRPYAMPVKKSILQQSKAAKDQAWAAYQQAQDQWKAISDDWNKAYFDHCRSKT